MVCKRPSYKGWPDSMCEQRACARGKHNTLSTKVLCSCPPGTMSGFHTGREGIMCKMPGSQHQTCSETSKAGAMFSPSPPKHGPLGPLLLVVREKLGQTRENPCFKGGRMKPSCFCASGEGEATPKPSGLGLRAHRWERGCGAG